MSNELLKVLISFGADIDEADKHGFTPLALLAAKQGEPADRTIPLMKLLLDNGADIFPKSLNGKVRLHGSPLHFSISLCNSQVLEFFIKRIHASGSREEKEKLKENFQECSNEIMNMYRWMGKLAQNSAVEKMLQECGLLGSVGVGDSVAP